MEEEWRNLVKTVPGTLFTVGSDIEGHSRTVTTARANLTLLAAAVHESEDEAPHIDDDELAALLRGPGDDLDGAIGELARLRALHAAAGFSFLIYAEHVGLAGGDDALWLGWQEHHAASRARAYEDVVRTAWSRSILSLGWCAWMSASVDLVLFARISGAMAIHSLRCMRKAITREFHDAWRVAYL